MGTYSNLVPGGVCNSIYLEEDPPWQAYEETDGTFTTTYEVSTDTDYGTARYTAEFRFDLPASVNVSNVTITANVYPSFNAQGTLYASITNYNGGSGGTSTSAQSASVTGIDAQRTFSFSGISFGNTNSFYVKFWSDNLAGGSPTRYESVGVGVIRANVLYTDPQQPRVTATSPSAQIFSDWESFTYQWSVSNGTQTQAVVQESTDNSNWINVGAVSGSGTNLSGTARYTASSGSSQSYSWRVVATFSDGTTKTSGSLSYSVLAPPPEPDYPPSVSNISTTPVQPSGLPSTFSSVYIANVSKCKVQASVSAGTYAIREVYFSYPGVEKVSMTYDSTARKYVGTTPLALSATTQTITITVTAVDTSGYYTAETVNVTVTPYADPTLTVNTLYRSNAQGAEDNTGQYYKIKVTASCSSVQSKNYITSLKAGVKNGTQHTLSSGSTYTFGPELPNEDLVYVIHISVTDYVGHETWIERSLAGRLRDVVFKRDVNRKTAHVGVGMTPDGNARTTVQLPPNGTIIIGGQDLIAWLQSKLGEDFPGWDQS